MAHSWTRVMSDMSKAYDCLRDEGYTHLTVNHSLNRHGRAPPAQWIEIHGGKSNKVCLVQEHSKISSKAVYSNGCGVSTMETILLQKHYQAYRRLIWSTQRCVNIVPRSYHCMHCSWCDCHFMEERNKIHVFITWDWIGRRKSRGKNATRHDEGKQ